MKFARFVIAWSFALMSTAAFAACPGMEPPPRTINAPAEQYANSKHFGLDDQEILVYDYGHRYDNFGKFRNPYFISNYAGALYRDYLQSECKNADLRRKFMIQADFLMASAEDHNGAAVWRYPFELPAFNLKAGWVSGIGQSRIAGILQRAYAVTGEDKYHVKAEAAMEAYLLSPADGGVATVEKDVIWMEETADEQGASYKILNGHITALAGILDFYQITNEQKWKDVFDKAVNAVRRDLPLFDAGWLTYYSLESPNRRLMAPRGGYNSLHVAQLLWLFDTVEDPIFLDWASRFMAYEVTEYDYTALGSVNPEKHGPSQAGGYFGNAYWSHATFPTWLDVATKEPNSFKGIALHSTSAKATPRDIVISARVDGHWKTVKEIKENTELQIAPMFDQPVTTDAFRVEIMSDNGNKNTVLAAAIPIPEKPMHAAIASDCNFRTNTPNFNFMGAMDRNEASSMRVYCAGWVIMPRGEARELTTLATGAEDSKLTVETSDGFGDWQNPVIVDAGAEATTPVSGKYVRISFGKDVSTIEKLFLQ